jgi:hypothetical protein
MVSVRPPPTCIELTGSDGAFTFVQIEEIERTRRSEDGRMS